MTTMHLTSGTLKSKRDLNQTSQSKADTLSRYWNKTYLKIRNFRSTMGEILIGIDCSCHKCIYSSKLFDIGFKSDFPPRFKH